MGYLDLVVLAAVVVLLLVRLWKTLGQRDENGRLKDRETEEVITKIREILKPGPGDKDVPRRPPASARPSSGRNEEESTEEIINQIKDMLKPSPADEEGEVVVPPNANPVSSTTAPLSLAGRLEQIRKLDPPFDEKAFLTGARKAFTMILQAFAAGDLAPVERFLAPSVAEGFRAVIQERLDAGNTLENRLENLLAAETESARLEGSRAFIGVTFTSLQINVTRDRYGRVVNGDPHRPEQIQDRWVFSRDVTSGDPSWQLVETLA